MQQTTFFQSLFVFFAVLFAASAHADEETETPVQWSQSHYVAIDYGTPFSAQTPTSEVYTRAHFSNASRQGHLLDANYFLSLSPGRLFVAQLGGHLIYGKELRSAKYAAGTLKFDSNFYELRVAGRLLLPPKQFFIRPMVEVGASSTFAERGTLSGPLASHAISVRTPMADKLGLSAGVGGVAQFAESFVSQVKCEFRLFLSFTGTSRCQIGAGYAL